MGIRPNFTLEDVTPTKTRKVFLNIESESQTVCDSFYSILMIL